MFQISYPLLQTLCLELELVVLKLLLVDFKCRFEEHNFVLINLLLDRLDFLLTCSEVLQSGIQTLLRDIFVLFGPFELDLLRGQVACFLVDFPCFYIDKLLQFSYRLLVCLMPP